MQPAALTELSFARTLLITLFIGLCGCDFASKRQALEHPVVSSVHLKKINFSDLIGWSTDNHFAALRTFLQSCKKIRKTTLGVWNKKTVKRTQLGKICDKALEIKQRSSKDLAREFFESWFLNSSKCSCGHSRQTRALEEKINEIIKIIEKED